MRGRRGSIRELLQEAHQIELPPGLYPWRRDWRFRRSGDQEIQLRRWIKRVRLLCDRMEAWLDNKPWFATIVPDRFQQK